MPDENTLTRVYGDFEESTNAQAGWITHPTVQVGQDLRPTLHYNGLVRNRRYRCSAHPYDVEHNPSGMSYSFAGIVFCDVCLHEFITNLFGDVGRMVEY